MNIKKIYLIGYLILSGLLLKAQTTLTITNQLMGNTGSADVILAQAQLLANSGQTVTINMNTSGLCDLTSYGTIGLYLTSGAIIIQKDPIAITTQGFSYSSYTINYGLYFICDSAVDVTIKNITFQNIGIGVTVLGGRSLIYENNKTLAVNSAIYIDDGGLDSNNVLRNILIQNNEFDVTGVTGGSAPVIVRQNSFDSKKQKYLKVYNNNFKKRTVGVFVGSQASYDRLKIEIKNNFSSIDTWGANVGSYQYYISSPATYSHSNTNYLFDLEFENNLQVGGLNLISPLNTWKILSNSFQHKNFGGSLVGITPNYSSTVTASQFSPFKTSFINSTSNYCLNQSFLNGNNSFLNHNSYPSNSGGSIPYYTSFSINGNGSYGCGLTEILDLNLPGSISITGNVSIRRNKIFSNFNPNFPIIRLNHITATLNPTSVSGGNLIASYTYTGITNADNNDLYVDFYKSNINGDLLDYIGEQVFLNGSITGAGSISLPIPSSITVNSNDRIAITLTGLHPVGSNSIVAIGTSAAYYQIVSCPQITSFTHINLPNNTGCQKFEFNAGLAYTGIPCPSSPLVGSINYGDGAPTYTNCTDGSGFASSHQFTSSGTYTVTLTVTGPGTCVATAKSIVTVTCSSVPCSDCISSFSPNPGKKYLVSAWVKEKNAPQSKTSYTYPSLTILFPSISASTSPFLASGVIIDGWQRVEGEFLIPLSATNMSIKLDCNTGDCYFDDVRVLPFDGSMKSYVYDPITMRLVAELDERNYATLYEYDEEGKLIRVKKETEKGIMTIQENRNNTKK